MREAGRILGEHADAHTAVSFVNLSESLLAVGDLAAAADARAEATRWADRLGNVRIGDLSRASQADSAYHAGEWTVALDLAGHAAEQTDETIAAWARWVRSRIALAGGDNAFALDNAHIMVEYARGSGDEESRLYALALLSLAQHTAGDAPGAAETGRSFFETWHATGGMPTSAPVLAELAPLTSQHADIGQAATLLPDWSRWKHALIAISRNRPADAAAAYAEMGSRPLEAAAHLLAAQTNAPDAVDHARRALDFYAAVGADALAAKARAHLRRSA